MEVSVMDVGRETGGWGDRRLINIVNEEKRCFEKWSVKRSRVVDQLNNGK